MCTFNAGEVGEAEGGWGGGSEEESEDRRGTKHTFINLIDQIN